MHWYTSNCLLFISSSKCLFILTQRCTNKLLVADTALIRCERIAKTSMSSLSRTSNNQEQSDGENDDYYSDPAQYQVRVHSLIILQLF